MMLVLVLAQKQPDSKNSQDQIDDNNVILKKASDATLYSMENNWFNDDNITKLPYTYSTNTIPQSQSHQSNMSKKSHDASIMNLDEHLDELCDKSHNKQKLRKQRWKSINEEKQFLSNIDESLLPPVLKSNYKNNTSQECYKNTTLQECYKNTLQECYEDKTMSGLEQITGYQLRSQSQWDLEEYNKVKQVSGYVVTPGMHRLVSDSNLLMSHAKDITEDLLPMKEPPIDNIDDLSELSIIHPSYSNRNDGVPPSLQPSYSMQNDGVPPSLQPSYSVQNDGVLPSLHPSYSMQNDGVPPSLHPSYSMQNDGVPPSLHPSYSMQNDGVPPSLHTFRKPSDDSIVSTLPSQNDNNQEINRLQLEPQTPPQSSQQESIKKEESPLRRFLKESKSSPRRIFRSSTTHFSHSNHNHSHSHSHNHSNSIISNSFSFKSSSISKPSSPKRLKSLLGIHKHSLSVPNFAVATNIPNLQSSDATLGNFKSSSPSPQHTIYHSVYSLNRIEPIDLWDTHTMNYDYNRDNHLQKMTTTNHHHHHHHHLINDELDYYQPEYYQPSFNAEESGESSTRISSLPSQVIGEYDKEKWRTIKTLNEGGM
ncbi:hypothetical protein KGF56_000728 [Candida oxycetoniae]|uniref:Uncharacterized protein n=1 Tax=Candida oxycetoniae TaxID=497107 RepID=A0AAI9WZN4_9ASCO|nr:uncharacterized protein KGF56_000728 [Candida oxycetoniae]KAI3406596.2 hypothetical protein KGF56_000728 [Candida oxycetoniae]